MARPIPNPKLLEEAVFEWTDPNVPIFWEDEALIGKISRHFGLTSIELEEPPTRCRRFPKYRNFEGHDEHIRHRRGYVEAGGTRLMDLELFV
jgi:hypothetical protein